MFEYPEGIFSNNMTNLQDASVYKISDNNFSNVNVIGNPIDTISVGISMHDSVSKYINLDLKEYQTSEPWCSAYAASTIIRTINCDRGCWVRTIMNYFYSSPSGKGLNSSDIVKYAKEKHSLKVKKTSSFSGNLGVQEINANRPVWFCMGSGGVGGTFHAVVLRGYNATSGIYSIWNPWYKYYENYPIGGTYTPTTDSSYKFQLYEAIYNWTK